jgi:hypothetical protein
MMTVFGWLLSSDDDRLRMVVIFGHLLHGTMVLVERRSMPFPGRKTMFRIGFG